MGRECLNAKIPGFLYLPFYMRDVNLNIYKQSNDKKVICDKHFDFQYKDGTDRGEGGDAALYGNIIVLL